MLLRPNVLAKAHKRYEFGCKIGVATASRGSWLVGAKVFHNNPYDGHTLQKSINQVVHLKALEHVFADMGYRGHNYTSDVKIHVGKRRRGHIPKSLWQWMRRRAAVEPIIGHLKRELEWIAID